MSSGETAKAPAGEIKKVAGGQELSWKEERRFLLSWSSRFFWLFRQNVHRSRGADLHFDWKILWKSYCVFPFHQEEGGRRWGGNLATCRLFFKFSFETGETKVDVESILSKGASWWQKDWTASLTDALLFQWLTSQPHMGWVQSEIQASELDCLFRSSMQLEIIFHLQRGFSVHQLGTIFYLPLKVSITALTWLNKELLVWEETASIHKLSPDLWSETAALSCRNWNTECVKYKSFTNTHEDFSRCDILFSTRFLSRREEEVRAAGVRCVGSQWGRGGGGGFTLILGLRGGHQQCQEGSRHQSHPALHLRLVWLSRTWMKLRDEERSV